MSGDAACLQPGAPVEGPDFIIIGAMKCATSTIHDQLAHQRGISMSEPKEPNFFADEPNWSKGPGWYSGLFSRMPPGDLKGESSTHYTKLPTYPRCARRLHEHLPNAKLIYVMRDPVDRLVSQYIHEWSQRVIDRDCPIDEAIERLPILVEYSRYAMQLTPYIELFGRSAILPVFFERVMHDPEPELARIAAHIGYDQSVEWNQEEAKNVSSQRQRRHPALDALLNLRVLRAARRTLMPESLRARIRSRWTMSQRPTLSPGSISALHARLDPDLRTLGDWLGIGLSCATFKQTVTAGPAPEWSDRQEQGHD